MFITAIAAAVLASTNPVVAAETPAPQPIAQSTAKPVAANANPRVCVVDMITGSRIRHQTCKRLAEWRAEGLDPLATR